MRCVVTGVERKDTPEERVRQAIARELMQRYGYRKEDMQLELIIQMGSSSDRRADIALFRPETELVERTQHGAYILIECKRADVHGAGFEAAKEQLKSYMVACGNAHYGMVIAGERRVCFREIKRPDGRYEVVEIDDIPRATVPRARFTVLGPSPFRAVREEPPEPPREILGRAPSRKAGKAGKAGKALSGKFKAGLVLSAVVLALVLGGACALARALRSFSGPSDRDASLPPRAPLHPPSTPKGPANPPLPHARTAPPTLAEWGAVEEAKLTPAGCTRRIQREWLKLTCGSRASPRAISFVRDMGAEGVDHFKWEKSGSVIDLVVRMAPSHRGEAVFEAGGASFTVGYDWMSAGPQPVMIWEPR